MLLFPSLTPSLCFIIIIDFNIMFIDASPVRIEAHKYMLISASPVFRAMLCGEFPKQDVIEVNDIDPEAFKQMLR